MKKRNTLLLTAVNIVLPILIIVGAAVLFLQNYLYNTRERVRSFSAADKNGTAFVFDDITLDIVTRGGDSGSWLSEMLVDSDGNALYKHAVGTIYEMVIINNTFDTLTDWSATVYIPEKMYVNNTWNGDFEYHQNVKSGREKTQVLNLAEYSSYDITLDCRMTAVGPMVVLNEGDYFVYYPNADMNETPIGPNQENSDKESGVRIGFIMYVPEKPIDYAADFSMGEIRYYLQTSIFKSPLFWVLGAMAVVWISCLLSFIIVRVNLKRFVEQQKRDEKAIEQMMQTIANFIEAKDPNTVGHSRRVAEYSKMLAEKMNFSEEECKRIYSIGLMHDCGKIYIPDEILSKPGRLTEQEYEIMKKHTVYGGDILRDFTAIEGIGLGALSHHERYDGKGYPSGVSGEDIPVIARIICVADSFDAMNSRRCYRSSLSPEVIVSELKNNSGKQFDPHIVNCMMSLIESGAIKMSEDD